MTRVLTAIPGIAVILAVTLWGPRWSFVVLVLAFAGLALDEFLNLTALRGLRRPGRWILVPGLAVTFAFSRDAEWVVWTLAAGVVALSLVSIAAPESREPIGYISTGTAGILYACLLPGFLLLMSIPTFWTLIATVWAGDTAAYFGGRLLGRHRLAPRLSPNKTVEGGVAGALASAGIGAGVGSIWLGVGFPPLAGICLIAGLAGQAGDLAESAMKRSAGVKDSSRLLPGHGGVLDRVDSLLFAAPVFQCLMMWVS